MKPDRSRQSRSIAQWLPGGFVAAILLLLATPVAFANARVTSIDGEAMQGKERLSMHDDVEQNELVETGAETSCSLLLAEGAVVQACNQASLRLRKGRRSGSQIVELNSGDLKASVGRRPADDPLEIHTPAAIATILGTTLHVSVDPETGDTTITSLHNRIRVESSDPSVEGSVTIEAGEAVTVVKGKPPSPKRTVDISSIGGMGDCLDDVAFHRAAVKSDRASQETEIMEIVTAVDIPSALPPVSSPGGGANVLSVVAEVSEPEIGPGGIDIDDGGVCQTADCGLFEIMEFPIPTPPPPCVGLPGDQCSF
jgi:hypothetical protein